ncbi:MAG: hypothetical protein H7070_07420 [Saprospiraceae bacterium]|nr:hypothetical protein [Pyrinomonadaceae bacterium]
MQMLKTGIILAFFFLTGMFIGCSGTQSNSNSSASNISPVNTAQTQANTAKDNIEELGLLVSLPFEAEEATWKEELEKNKLTAVLRFTAEDTKKILAGLQQYTPAQPVNITTERWFPADLIAQSEMNGDNLLKGNSYSAQDFYRPPYTNGKIVKIENSDYLILELFSK